MIHRSQKNNGEKSDIYQCSYNFCLFFFLLFSWIDNCWATSHNLDPTPRSVSESPSSTQTPAECHIGDEVGRTLPLWLIIPFAGILLSIALFPLLAPSFWHHHYPKVSAFWALILAIPFIFYYHGEAFHKILHIYIVDYIPFIILLGALFTISGGIVVRGDLRGTPIVNTVLLFIGTILASWVGTTGASMIMIRPVLRANAFK